MTGSSSKRQQQNKHLLEILKSFVEIYPEMRFTQLLFCLGFTEKGIADHTYLDDFHLENEELIKRVERAVENVCQVSGRKKDDDE